MVRKGRDSVLEVVTADKLDVSCVLPVLTCWVELCADHIFIRALGTIGCAWGTSMLYQPHVYKCWQTMFSPYLCIITLAISLCTVVKHPQQSNKDVLTVY